MENLTYLYETHIRDLKPKKVQYFVTPITAEDKRGTIEIEKRQIWFYSSIKLEKTRWFKKCLKKLSKEADVKSVAFQQNLHNVDMSRDLWEEYEDLIIEWAQRHSQIKVLICSAYEEPSLEDDESEELGSGEDDESEESDESEDEDENEYDEEDSFIATDDEEEALSFSDESGTFSEFSDASTEETDSEDDGLDGTFILSELTRALEKLKSLGVKTELCNICGKWEECGKTCKIIKGECSECRDADKGKPDLSDIEGLTTTESDEDHPKDKDLEEVDMEEFTASFKKKTKITDSDISTKPTKKAKKS